MNIDELKNYNELNRLFREIEEIVHNLEIFAKGEDIALDTRDLAPLFKNLIRLLVIKVFYKKENFLKLDDIKQRLYCLESDVKRNRLRDDEDDEDKRPLYDLDFFYLNEKILTLIDDLIDPFMKRHKSLYEKDLRNIMAFVNEEEYSLLEKDQIQSSVIVPNDKKVIVWNGTPGEFGAIMNELIEKGFILKIKDLKNTVRLLNQIFEVRNDNGEIVTDKYLYRCFSEKKKGYYHHEFKIPVSDNLNKSE